MADLLELRLKGSVSDETEADYADQLNGAWDEMTDEEKKYAEESFSTWCELFQRKEQVVSDRPLDLLPARVEPVELAVCAGCGAVRPAPPGGLYGTNDVVCCHCQKCYAVEDWRKPR